MQPQYDGEPFNIRILMWGSAKMIYIDNESTDSCNFDVRLHFVDMISVTLDEYYE
jgi:hypothetical protein